MQIKFVRLDAYRSESIVARNDRVSLRVPGYGPAILLPHDLAHFVIEKELGLRRGFWGSVAEGAKFPGMTVVSGRRRPHAEARSAALCKANARRVTEVEVIISVLSQIVKEEIAPASRRATMLINERWMPKRGSEIGDLSPPVIEGLCKSLQVMARRWSEVGIGDELVVQW